MTADIRLPVDDEIEQIARTASMVGAVDEDDARAMEDDAREQLRQHWERDSRRTLAGMLRTARRIRAELDEDAKYLAMIAAEIERKNAGKRGSLAFLEQQAQALGEQLLVVGSKHVDVPGAGRLQFTDRKAGVRIADPLAFIAALDADTRPSLIEIVEKLKTNDAKKYAEAVLQQDGELLPGVERVEAQRTATIAYDELWKLAPHPERDAEDLTPALEASIAAVAS